MTDIKGDPGHKGKKNKREQAALEEGREPKVGNHPADVPEKDQERPLAERVEIAAGFEPKHYGER